MNNKFKILVTQYNAVDYIQKCLDSIMEQTYKNYEIVIVDDCSTDGTLDIAQKYPAFIIRNAHRTQIAYLNFQKGIQLHPNDPNEIIVLLSGDDYFSSNDVLEHLNSVYQDENIWLTYGQFTPSSKSYGEYCRPIPNIRTYRKSGLWVTSHLVTFKKWLWDKIKEEDFKCNGEFPKFGFDRAFMYPMIEMSGSKHIKFITKVLYIYNDQNPICLFKVNPEESIKWADYFINKQPYDEL
jgi:glycosyltransferase involved in cell wall biosynthesis